LLKSFILEKIMGFILSNESRLAVQYGLTVLSETPKSGESVWGKSSQALVSS
jgi:hypothetical protein